MWVGIFENTLIKIISSGVQINQNNLRAIGNDQFDYYQSIIKSVKCNKLIWTIVD